MASAAARWGWAAIAAAGLARFASGPGQTFSISILASAAARELDIGPDALAGLYGSATVVSGLSMGLVGGMVDRFGARRVSVVACIVLTVACGLAASSSSAWMLWPAFFLSRLAGQGTLSIVGASIIARWFDSARGFATSASGLGIVLAATALPLADAALITTVGWRTAWAVQGVAVIAVCMPLLALLARSSPGDVGVTGDFGRGKPAVAVGDAAGDATGTEGVTETGGGDGEGTEETAAECAAREAEEARAAEVTSLLDDSGGPAEVPGRGDRRGGKGAADAGGSVSFSGDEEVEGEVVGTRVPYAAALRAVRALGTVPSLTVRQAAGTGAFWALLAVDFERAAVNTAVTFFLGGIVAEAAASPGWDGTGGGVVSGNATAAAGEAAAVDAGTAAASSAAVLAIMAGVGLPAALLTGCVADRVGASRLLSVTFLFQAAFLLVLAYASRPWMTAAAGVLWGCAVGCEQILLPVMWPALFGTEHIGALRGVDFQALVVGSAVGPIAFGVLRSMGATHASLILGCIPVALLAALISLAASRGVPAGNGDGDGDDGVAASTRARRAALPLDAATIELAAAAAARPASSDDSDDDGGASGALGSGDSVVMLDDATGLHDDEAPLV